MLTIIAARATPPATLAVELSNGRTLTVDASQLIGSAGYRLLSDPERFSAITVADWGHAIEWPAIDQGLAIDTLIRLAREQAGTAFPTTDFNAWMQCNGLDIRAAAEALGLPQRAVVRYHAGQKPIPIYIGLACEGWEARRLRAAA